MEERSYRQFLTGLGRSFESIPSFRWVVTADRSRLAVNTRKRRASEVIDPRPDFPYPIGVLYSVSRLSVFGRPRDFEQEGFALRALDILTWMKGSVPDKWINCNVMGPEAAMQALTQMAEEEYSAEVAFKVDVY